MKKFIISMNFIKKYRYHLQHLHISNIYTHQEAKETQTTKVFYEQQRLSYGIAVISKFGNLLKSKHTAEIGENSVKSIL